MTRQPHPRLLPRRLRWRLVTGFIAIIAVLLTLLTVAERLILEQSLRAALVSSMETTIHAGLGNQTGGFVTEKMLYAMLAKVVGASGLEIQQDKKTMLARVAVTEGFAPDQAAVLKSVQQKALQTEVQQLSTLSAALAVTDEPAAMLDSAGDVLAGTATLSHDRERVRHLNEAVLARLTAAARAHIRDLNPLSIVNTPGIRTVWLGQVNTDDGPYLVVLQSTDLPVLGLHQHLDPRWLSLVASGQVGDAKTDASWPWLALDTGSVSRPRLMIMMARNLDSTLGTVRTVTLVTVCGALIVLVLATLLSLLVVGAALRPFALITTGAERLAAGDYSHRLALRAGTDEIGQLAAAFDYMASAIGTAFATQRRFVADASHELRTPLTALRGYTDVLLMGAAEDRDERERILHAMEEDLRRMSRLVNDLLTLARLDGGAPLQLGLVSLDELLAAVTLEAAAIVRGSRRILLEPVPADLAVWGDRDRLRQVLSNIVGNACTYTMDGCTITVRARRLDRSAVLEVQDNGAGIAPEDLARIGERFFRGDTARSRQHGGAGLGVAIARGIVQAHGGTLAIGSVMGHGTTVTVSLPLAQLSRL